MRPFTATSERGSILIQEACRKNGLRSPEWMADASSVTLVFHAIASNARLTRSREKGGEKSREKILAAIRDDPNIMMAELAKATRLSVKGEEKNIRILQRRMFPVESDPIKAVIGKWLNHDKEPRLCRPCRDDASGAGGAGGNVSWLKDGFGNPSSLHSFGRKAWKAVEEARVTIADYIAARSKEIILLTFP